MASKKMQKSYIDVLGLCCSSEVPLIEKILKSLEGVKDVTVIVPSRIVIVVHDNLLISQLQIVKALNEARLEANVRVYGESKYQKKWPSPYAITCGALLLLSLFKYLYHPFQWLAIGAVLIGIVPIAMKGLMALWNFTLDINILVLIAVGGTIALNDYLEAGTIVFLFTIADWLETRASHKATAAMSSLMSIAPQKAVIAESGEEVQVDEVKINTIIAVKAGEAIPIDGIVVDGSCEVDEKTLTGESFPVAKQVDSTVWAGTINLNGYVSVKTTAIAEECVVAKMAKIVEEAQNNKSRTQRFIDRCTKYYTPVVVLISIGVAIIPVILKLDNKHRWFHLALVVLVSACPCALILSTPVATFCALSNAASNGVLIKGGDYLEILAKIKIMAFDKTGTITRGEFVVTNFQSLCDGVSAETLLHWVSSIESKSSHPMAAALVYYGRSYSVEPNPESVEEFWNFPGEGIHGKINGKDIYIGNQKIRLRAGCQTVPSMEGDSNDGNSIGYIYVSENLAGIFSLSDKCRTGVAEAIKELKSMGITSSMLTGDSRAAAMHAQQQLKSALEEVHAELLPEDKGKIIQHFKKTGPTAMVGDGINDAPALAMADIGISMGISGSALATETGHIILMTNDLRKIPKAVSLGRRTRMKIIQNIAFSITTKTAIVALAISGHPLVWAAVLADVGTCLAVILNSMLLLRHAKEHKHTHTSSNDHHHCSKKAMNSCSSSHKHQHPRTHNKQSMKPPASCCSTNSTSCDAPKTPQFCSSSSCCEEKKKNLNTIDHVKDEEMGVIDKECCDHCDHDHNEKHQVENEKCCDHDHGHRNHLKDEEKCSDHDHVHGHDLGHRDHLKDEEKCCDHDHGHRHHLKYEEKCCDHGHHDHKEIDDLSRDETCCDEDHHDHEDHDHGRDVHCLESTATDCRLNHVKIRREVGGGCRSYGKGCCKQVHFGGGLSEIITE